MGRDLMAGKMALNSETIVTSVIPPPMSSAVLEGSWVWRADMCGNRAL